VSGRQEPDQPRDLDAEARRTLELAVHEAVELGHDRIGTEHLLLGLLAKAGNRAARALADAGVTVAAARHEVVEAPGPKARPTRRTGGRARSPRASRALNRAVRFSHAGRSELVTSEHVLLGVLDVEGTAGQVLRRLGVDACGCVRDHRRRMRRVRRVPRSPVALTASFNRIVRRPRADLRTACRRR
jgi:ATP-dependent Clp protease ATP-binding subunit ClpA